MAGALLMVASVAEARALDGTVTIGSSGDTYGYVQGSFGSLDVTTYEDSSGATRTVVGIAEDQSALPSPTTLSFQLDGEGIPNEDTTFRFIVINGNKFERANATYDGAASGASQWTWSASGVIDTSGTDPFEVWI